MARKPEPLQPFTGFLGEATPAEAPADDVAPAQGDHDAVQDDNSRTPAAEPAAARETPRAEDAASGAGSLRPGAEGPSPSLQGAVGQGQAGQRPEPDSERSAGD